MSRRKRLEKMAEKYERLETIAKEQGDEKGAEQMRLAAMRTRSQLEEMDRDDD